MRADAVHDQAGLAGDVTALDANRRRSRAPRRASPSGRRATRASTSAPPEVADAFPRAGIVPLIASIGSPSRLPTAAALGASNAVEVAAASANCCAFVLEQRRAVPLVEETDAADAAAAGVCSSSRTCTAFLGRAATTATGARPPRRPPRRNARGAVAQPQMGRCCAIAAHGASSTICSPSPRRAAPGGGGGVDGEGKRAATSPMATQTLLGTSSRSRCSSPAARSLPTSSPRRRPTSRPLAEEGAVSTCASSAARWREPADADGERRSHAGELPLAFRGVAGRIGAGGEAETFFEPMNTRSRSPCAGEVLGAAGEPTGERAEIAEPFAGRRSEISALRRRTRPTRSPRPRPPRRRERIAETRRATLELPTRSTNCRVAKVEAENSPLGAARRGPHLAVATAALDEGERKRRATARLEAAEGREARLSKSFISNATMAEQREAEPGAAAARRRRAAGSRRAASRGGAQEEFAHARRAEPQAATVLGLDTYGRLASRRPLASTSRDGLRVALRRRRLADPSHVPSQRRGPPVDGRRSRTRRGPRDHGLRYRCGDRLRLHKHGTVAGTNSAGKSVRSATRPVLAGGPPSQLSVIPGRRRSTW